MQSLEEWFQTQGAGLKQISICPEKKSLRGGGHDDISKRHMEEGLLYSGGDSEDTIRTEGQRCSVGNSQLWHPRRGLVK